MDIQDVLCIIEFGLHNIELSYLYPSHNHKDRSAYFSYEHQWWISNTVKSLFKAANQKAACGLSQATISMDATWSLTAVPG